MRERAKAAGFALAVGGAGAVILHRLDWDTVPGVLLLVTVMLFVYGFLKSYLQRTETPLSLLPRSSQSRSAPGAVGLAGDSISISALSDPSLVVSVGWRVLAANASALALFGPRVQGSDLRQTVRHPVVVDAVRLGFLGQAPAVREVTTLGQRDGAFGVRVVNLADGRLLLTFSDVTQARLTERMRADFVANASHELRTPLANISGFIETLLGPAAEDEPARRRFLEIMAREAARMSRLIDDLLSLSRIELDKYVRPQMALDLAPLLADVGRTLAMRLEEDGRKLVFDVPDDLPQVTADRDQILQVVHNLVSNALKYGHTGSPITVSARRSDGEKRGEEMVRVSVVDEGDGIAPEHLPRLTERFYRVDASRSRSMGGTGLGLAIVKHIVERHRGRLEISSQQGVGSTISFLLPVVRMMTAPDVADVPAVRAGDAGDEVVVGGGAPAVSSN